MAARNDPVAEAAPVVRAVEKTLGNRVCGLYLYGSAVTSGLRDDSDLDLLAVVDTGLTAATRTTLADELMQVSGRWPRSGPARPVELTVVVRDHLVPWHYPPRSDFVYGEWLRDEFARGIVSAPAADPDLTILVTMVLGSSIPLLGPPAGQVLGPVPPGDVIRAVSAGLAPLLATADGDERNTVLTLARMWVTAETGTVVSKAEAAGELAAQLPAEHAEILCLARAGYLGTAADDWTHRQREVAAFAHEVGARIAAACARRAPE